MRTGKVARRALAATAIAVPVFFAAVAGYNDITYKPPSKRLVYDQPASDYVKDFDPNNHATVAVATQRAIDDYMRSHTEKRPIVPLARVEGDRVRVYEIVNEPRLLSFRNLSYFKF